MLSNWKSKRTGISFEVQIFIFLFNKQTYFGFNIFGSSCCFYGGSWIVLFMYSLKFQQFGNKFSFYKRAWKGMPIKNYCIDLSITFISGCCARMVSSFCHIIYCLYVASLLKVLSNICTTAIHLTQTQINRNSKVFVEPLVYVTSHLVGSSCSLLLTLKVILNRKNIVITRTDDKRVWSPTLYPLCVE